MLWLQKFYIALFLIQHTAFAIPFQDDKKQDNFMISSDYLYTKDDHNIDIRPIDRSPSLTPSANFTKFGDNGIISSDLEICNKLVIDEILTKFPGTNAADATVTMALCIGMINFFNSGIGGGGYLVMHDHLQNENINIDFRELSSSELDPKMFQNELDTKIGGLSIAVPGELKGLYKLFSWKGSGKVKWSQLLDPIIKLGENGWYIDEVLSATLDLYETFFINNKKMWKFVLNSKGDKVLQKGDLIKRVELAKTLRILAQNESVDPFYDASSDLVKSMVKTIHDNNGVIIAEDFDDYDIHVTEPIVDKIRHGFQNIPYNDLTVITSSGSSSGAALMSALKVMDKFSNEIGGDYQIDTTYKLVEAMKWMASGRSRLGDYVTDYLPERIKFILKDSWIDKIYQNIISGITNDPDNRDLKKYKTLPDFKSYDPLYELNEPHGTAHFSIVDSFGNAVSLTTTVNLLFGSLVHDPETGVIFNNEIDDFAQEGRQNSFELAPSVYNLIKPNSRPLSSAAPTIILNELGQVDLIIGASGGSRITTSILQAIIRIYWYNMPLLETIAYPRLHHQLIPDQVEVESINMIGKGTISSLADIGYKIIENYPKSVINAIKKHERNLNWVGVSDYWRKRGISVGY